MRYSPLTRSGPTAWSAPLPEPGDRWALLLDVDGTLLEIAARPDDVVADPQLNQLLCDLHDRCGGALAIISGRSIADVDRVFHPHILPAAGQHGLERRDAAGRVHRHGASDGLRLALARLRRFEAHHPGIVVEDKGASLALHYRMAPDAAGPAIDLVTRVAAELGSRFETLSGAMVIEVRPAGRDKGTAIGDFLREPPFQDRVPVFVGDDRTDEFGFALVNRCSGHTVKVGPGASSATWRLPDASGVRQWLARVVQAIMP